MDAQELRLQEALNSLEAAKTVQDEQQQTPVPISSSESIENLESSSQQMPSSWDMLERVIGLEGDLLTSYREYTRELEKRVKKEENRRPRPIADRGLADLQEQQEQEKNSHHSVPGETKENTLP